MSTIYRCIACGFEDKHLNDAVHHAQAKHADVKNPHELIIEREPEDFV